MRASTSAVMGLFLAGLLAASCAPAGAGRQGPPRTPQRFDPHEELQTVDGEVLGVDNIPLQDQLAYGAHLTVRNDLGRPVSVRLAPGWYLARKGLRFSPSERLEVRGFPSEIEGEPAIVTEEVLKDGKVIRLRDEYGRPLWRLHWPGAGSAPVPPASAPVPPASAPVPPASAPAPPASAPR